MVNNPLVGSHFLRGVGIGGYPYILTLPETNIAPKNGWLEYYFPIGKVTFQGRLLLVSGRVDFLLKIPCITSSLLRFDWLDWFDWWSLTTGFFSLKPDSQFTGFCSSSGFWRQAKVEILTQKNPYLSSIKQTFQPFHLEVCFVFF